MINITKGRLLKTTIAFIIIILAISRLALLYNKHILKTTTLKSINSNITSNKVIIKDRYNNTITLDSNNRTGQYINKIHDIFNKSVKLNRISSDMFNSVISGEGTSIVFDKTKYIIGQARTVVVKILKTDMEKINLLNRLTLSFDKDKYIYYRGKLVELKKTFGQIDSILEKSIGYSSKKEIYENIKMLTPLKREFGSKDEREASKRIKNTMTAYGYQTEIQKFTFTPRIARPLNAVIDKRKLAREEKTLQKHFPPRHSQNVISIKKSYAPSKGIIIICAHYDCTSENGSTGAIDNGTGVSAVIEIAKCLRDIQSHYELRYVFFSGEEKFLLGSKYYVRSLSKKEIKNIKAVINLDTIGSKSNDQFAMVTADGKENSSTAILKKFATKLGIKVEKGPISDYKAFGMKKIPSVCIGQVPINMSDIRSELNIDTNQDTIRNVDIDKVKLISDMIIDALKELIINVY